MRLLTLLMVALANPAAAALYIVWDPTTRNESGAAIDPAAIRYRLQYSLDGSSYRYLTDSNGTVEIDGTEYLLREDIGQDCVYITLTAWHVVTELESRPSEPYMYCPGDYADTAPIDTGASVTTYPPDPVTGMRIEVR